MEAATGSGLPVLAAACGLCGGRCCALGGDRAFLEASTVRRVLQTWPEPDPDRIRATYLGRLPHVTWTNSFVYHATNGCALPRELRAMVCIRFLCTGLTDLLGTAETENAPVNPGALPE